MAIDHIRVSQQAKDQMIRLKRATGLENWNVLCRWAYCLSLAEKSAPPNKEIPADSNVEMSWQVFGGKHHGLYLALLKERCIRDGIDTDGETLARQFRLHLHRGIAYLASDRNINGIGALLSLAESAEPGWTSDAKAAVTNEAVQI